MKILNFLSLLQQECNRVQFCPKKTGQIPMESPFPNRTSIRESPWFLAFSFCLELRCYDALVQQLYCNHKDQSHVTRMNKNDILMLKWLYCGVTIWSDIPSLGFLLYEKNGLLFTLLYMLAFFCCAWLHCMAVLIQLPSLFCPYVFNIFHLLSHYPVTFQSRIPPTAHLFLDLNYEAYLERSCKHIFLSL